MRCWAVQNCAWYQRVRELRRWGVLQRDRREQRERVYFMPGGDVLERFRRERVCELSGGDDVGGRGKWVCLSCEYISKSRFTLHELSAQLELVCC